ncbi:MAG: DUF2218 domain-containing protein [Pelagimonas sp.]|uniref:DUF2218 domain-containing protein n=1 Tax=Pelagimonas sp. TaxID=2073170 RepID=UPI003D6B4A75
MHALTGTFETPNASKYLQQLCKHFAHKIEVTFSETEGSCAFPMGTAQLRASNDRLNISFELADSDKVDMAKSVIDKHLERFAFREDFTNMDWSSDS